MELTLLAVKREYERLGIGTMMLTFVQQQAHKASATLLVGALHHETPHHSLYC
jgi:ribosomal protein S18 acetylase RimI-like enzyme